jgi:hypothetical protein
VIHTSHAGVVVSESSETVRHSLDFNSRAKRLASDENKLAKEPGTSSSVPI